MPIRNNTKSLPNLLNRFQNLEFLAQKVVEGLVTGKHKSPFKGYSIDFKEHRNYLPGDDLRYLDWKLLGRSEKLYIKQFEEDTDMRVSILLDSSGSMNYSNCADSKFAIASYSVAVFSYLFTLQQDYISLNCTNSEEKINIPSKTGKKHLKKIIETLESSQAIGKTNITESITTLANQLKRRSFVVIISDFFEDIDRLNKALKLLSHKKHQILLLQVLDKKEVNFEFDVPVNFSSLETDTQFTINPKKYQNIYKKSFEIHHKKLFETCNRLHYEFHRIFTDDPFEKSIARILNKRAK